MRRELYRRTIDIGFRALADQIGHEFNPSYEMGTVSKITGRTAYVQINTSAMRNLKKSQQAVEVVDEDNNVLASIQVLQLEDGSLSGTVYEKAGKSVGPGMKVRSRIKAF